MEIQKARITKIFLGFINSIKQFFSTYAIIFAILALGIVLSFASDTFLTVKNIVNVLRQISMVAIMAVGSYFVMVSGGIDASLGAIVGFSSIVCAVLIVQLGLTPLVAITITLLCGGIAGLINGITTSRFSIPPLIATIGLKMVLVGVTYIICKGYTISGVPDEILFFGRGYLANIKWMPIPVVIMVATALIANFVSQRTRFGRFLYAIGGSAEAAHLSGIRYKFLQMWTYVIAGVLSAVAGIIITGRLASGNAGSGDGWEFDAIIACVIGGVSTTGGRGRVFGVILGTVMMGVLNNGMTLLDINSYFQQVASGLVLMIAIGFDIYSVNSKSKAIRTKGK